MPDRIKNPLPIPECCDNCASFDVVFTGNQAVYGRPYGDWPFVYFCSSCGAAVGCHPGTRIPLGRMADKKTRQLRARAHKHFDPLWHSGAMSRTEAYMLLSRQLGIPHEQCHISQLTVEQLKFVIEKCISFTNNIEPLKRRKEKKNAKKVKRDRRDKHHAERFSKFTKRNSSARRSRRSKQNRD